MRDEVGEGLADVPVVPLVEDWSSGQLRFSVARSAHITKTDDRGVYRLSDMAPGTYAIAVPAADVRYAYGPTDLHPLTRFATSFFPGTDQAAAAALVSVYSGDVRTGVDFSLLPTIGRTVEGRIEGASGQHTWTIELTLLSSLPTALDARSAEVDEGGRFRFASVPPGRYRLTATAFPSVGNFRVIGGIPTLAFRPGEPLPQVPDRPTLWAEDIVVVSNEPILPLTLRPQAAARVSGTLVLDGADVRAFGSVLSATYVSLVPADGRNLVGETAAIVDPGGHFITAGVPPGCYVFWLRFPGAGWRLESITANGSPLERGCVEVGAGDVDAIQLRMTSRPSRVSGAVYDREAKPMALVGVLAIPTSPGQRFATPALASLQRTWSDRKGQYAFVGLPPGDYFLVATEAEIPDGWMNPDYLDRFSAQGVRVHIEKGAVVAQNLVAIR